MQQLRERAIFDSKLGNILLKINLIAEIVFLVIKIINAEHNNNMIYQQ